MKPYFYVLIASFMCNAYGMYNGDDLRKIAGVSAQQALKKNGDHRKNTPPPTRISTISAVEFWLLQNPGQPIPKQLDGKP